MIVYDQQLLNAMLMQDGFCIAESRADWDRDQVLLGHHLTDRNIGPGFEAEIAIGEDANQFLFLVTGTPDMR